MLFVSTIGISMASQNKVKVMKNSLRQR